MNSSGLNFSNIHEQKNGIPIAFGLMAAHAVISMWFAAWYSQVRVGGLMVFDYFDDI